MSVTASSIGQSLSSVSQTRAAERLDKEKKQMEALVLVDSDLLELKRSKSLKDGPETQNAWDQPPSLPQSAESKVESQRTAGDKQSLAAQSTMDDGTETQHPGPEVESVFSRSTTRIMEPAEPVHLAHQVKVRSRESSPNGW